MAALKYVLISGKTNSPNEYVFTILLTDFDPFISPDNLYDLLIQFLNAERKKKTLIRF